VIKNFHQFTFTEVHGGYWRKFLEKTGLVLLSCLRMDYLCLHVSVGVHVAVADAEA